VDPHTHLVFAGSREDELERKIAGESYAEILKSGGGILRTLRETRKANLRRIVDESQQRVAQLVKNGVTTIEVKTGYGQDLEGEIKQLAALGELKKKGGVELVGTFLGLHAVPPEFRTSREYVAYATGEMLPRIAGLKDRPRFSDCFCEEGVFSREECARYLKASKALGFAGKIHADEFTDSGGASLAAEAQCVSADHLGKSDPEGLKEMADRNVVAVLLPMTSLYSGIGYADAGRVIDSGCVLALGTDLSPNSWIESPQMVMGVACAALRITPAEALLGFTANAASAIARTDIGRIQVGYRADFVLHNLPSYRFLPYRVGGMYVRSVYKGGDLVFDSGEN